MIVNGAGISAQIRSLQLFGRAGLNPKLAHALWDGGNQGFKSNGSSVPITRSLRFIDMLRE